MNSSSSSSSSSPFSESICMASSMKLTAFPGLGAEFWSLPNEASLVSLSFSWVKYCKANSSRSLGWFLNTSTVKLCNSSVSPWGISILIPGPSLWMWTKPVCCEREITKRIQLKRKKEAGAVRPTGQQAIHSGSSLFLQWKMALDFLVQASSASCGYRKPTHVTQESMATTYPGIACERRRRRSQSQNTNDGKERPCGWKYHTDPDGERERPFGCLVTYYYYHIIFIKSVSCGTKNVQDVPEGAF